MSQLNKLICDLGNYFHFHYFYIKYKLGFEVEKLITAVENEKNKISGI